MGREEGAERGKTPRWGKNGHPEEKGPTPKIDAKSTNTTVHLDSHPEREVCFGVPPLVFEVPSSEEVQGGGGTSEE